MSTKGMKRHVGVIKNTGKNVAVVFMSLPGDENNCLVLDIDALPDIFQETMRKLLDSNQAQQTDNLADIMSRRQSPDGSNMTLLNKFHSAGRLQKLPVELITMTPRRGVNIPLKDVLNAIRSQNDPVDSGMEEMDAESASIALQEMQKFNSFANNITADTVEGNAAKAQDLIHMAEMLEADAAHRRAQAYRIAPELAPAHKRAKAKVVKVESNDSVDAAVVDPLSE